MNTTRTFSLMTDLDPAGGRWEPCLTFASAGDGSPVCGDCGWLLDDHHTDAVVSMLPARVPRTVQPRRLAS
jgi:hypothetical protein